VSCSDRANGEYGGRNCLNSYSCDLRIEIGNVPEYVNNFHRFVKRTAVFIVAFCVPVLCVFVFNVFIYGENY